MRIDSPLLLSAALLLATSAPATAQELLDGEWNGPPLASRLVLLLTGSDRGYVEPKACWGVHGGTLYRPAFTEWHDRQFPAVERLWLGAGELLATPDDNDTVDDAEMWRHLARIGYAALTPGPRDLASRGPFALLHARQKWDLPFVATNLRRHETGQPLFDASMTLETSAGRLLLLAIVPGRPGQLWFSPDEGTVVVTDPVRAVREELDAQPAPPDAVVLLSTLSQLELRQVLGRLDGIDLVVASDGLYATRSAREVQGHSVLWLGAWGHVLGRAYFGDGGRLLEADTVEVRGAFPIDAYSGRPVEVEQPAAPGP